MSAGQFIRCLVADLPGYCLVAIAATLALDVAVAVACGAGLDSRWASVAVVMACLAMEAGLTWWMLGIERVQRWVRGS